MNLENIRCHIAVTLLVLGCSIPVMGMVVWVITEIIPLEDRALKIAYLTTYVFIVLLGLRFYIPRMRGMT